MDLTHLCKQTKVESVPFEPRKETSQMKKKQNIYLCILDLRELSQSLGPPSWRRRHDCRLDDPAPLLLLLSRKRNKKKRGKNVSGKETTEANREGHITMGEGVLGAILMAAERWCRLSASILRLFSCTVLSLASSYGDIPCFATAAISQSQPCSLARSIPSTRRCVGGEQEAGGREQEVGRGGGGGGV
jgi:hypothetical protein